MTGSKLLAPEQTESAATCLLPAYCLNGQVIGLTMDSAFALSSRLAKSRPSGATALHIIG